MSPNSIMTIWRRMVKGYDVYIANIIIMYTRAKEIGRKVMAGGRKSYDAACSRTKLLIRFMEVIIFIETIPVTPS